MHLARYFIIAPALMDEGRAATAVLRSKSSTQASGLAAGFIAQNRVRFGHDIQSQTKEKTYGLRICIPAGNFPQVPQI